MKFASTLDELEHWTSLLEVEICRGAERRYLLAICRLCEVFAKQVSRDKRAPSSDLSRRMRASLRWLDLKRAIDASKPVEQPSRPRPRLRLVGNRSI